MLSCPVLATAVDKTCHQNATLVTCVLSALVIDCVSGHVSCQHLSLTVSLVMCPVSTCHGLCLWSRFLSAVVIECVSGHVSCQHLSLNVSLVMCPVSTCN